MNPPTGMIAGEDYGRETIKRLGPRLFNVYVQNHRLNPRGEGVVRTWNQGPVRLDHIGLWESGGVDFEEIFLGLQEVGYRGFVHRAPGLCGHHVGSGSRPAQRQVHRALDGVKGGALTRAFVARFRTGGGPNRLVERAERTEAWRDPGFAARFAEREPRPGGEQEMALDFLSQLEASAAGVSESFEADMAKS